MKNITLSVPDEVYRRARIKAAEQGRSVSAMVAELLGSLGDEDAEFERLLALQDQVLGEIREFEAGDRMSRDELHARALR